ncbi:hypothetical protein MHB77_12730 [Paenibacillus sp. FSL K6-3166]|uniref:hypothetical protein n=1 Tax=unclassified Paenibacillus TaxID=185978 RepID=UPI000B9FC76F|nr:hypothetical protein [Paenibacillus sp. VTT E-133291]OZQ85406.1 hypothetical protein CA598_21015 [Paenibacillus sp. VTT E-133291]
MNNYTVIKRIADDLKIRKVPEEKQEVFLSRIVYSALSMWIRYSTLDEDILNQSIGKIGVSKIHIYNRCKLFLENMIQMYPTIEKWFYPEDQNTRPIEIVRERLYQGGELVDVGFHTDISLPFYEESLINSNVVVTRGLQSAALNKITGLAQLKHDERENFDPSDTMDFFGLESKSASARVVEYLKLIKWSKRSEINAQVFNKYSMNIFSNSWDADLKLNDHDVTIYRNPLYWQGNRDYGFIKKINNTYYTSQINEYLIEQYEVRRFMYGLKENVGNPVSGKYKRFQDKNLFLLHLSNGLPTKEENILMLLGWPMKNINDKYNFIFDGVVWNFIREILNNLNIKLEEIK